MGFRAGLRFFWQNYGYPCIYAAGAAALPVAYQAIQQHNPLSGTALATAAFGAVLTFLATRLDPKASAPVFQPHEAPPPK